MQSPSFILLYAFLIGTIFGSFANVLGFRLPLGKTIALPPSFCPACGQRIKPYDLVPVISYMVLRGKCRECKAKISPMYPVVEFSSGLLFVATAFFYPLPAAMPFAMLAFALVVIALVDVQVQEIPDSMLVLIVAAAFFWIAVDPDSVRLLDALIGAVAGAVPLFLLDRITLVLMRKDGFGYGDMKLMGAVGLFLGWQGVLVTFFLAFVLAAIFAVYLLRTKKVKPGSNIAFGPFICFGTIAAVWSHAYFGEHLISFIRG